MRFQCIPIKIRAISLCILPASVILLLPASIVLPLSASVLPVFISLPLSVSILEEKIGSIRYGILYLASGILAGCASMGYNMLQNDNVVSKGASGAIFGVIGAMLFVVLARRNEEDRYTVRQIAVLAVLSLYGGLTSQGVDNAAHFGGFIAGFILAWILTMLQKRRGVLFRSDRKSVV